jgi:hypothetical protein
MGYVYSSQRASGNAVYGAQQSAGVTLYWVVYADGGADPSAEQIVAGDNATGADALASGSETYNGPDTYDEQTAITTLSAGTAYRVAWTSYDGSSYGNVTVSDAITTTSASTNVSVTLTGAAASAAAAALAATGAAQIVLPSTLAAAVATDIGATGSSASVPTLSMASVINITSTSATPRVYVTLPA